MNTGRGGGRVARAAYRCVTRPTCEERGAEGARERIARARVGRTKGVGGVGSCLTRHRRTVGEIWAPPKRAFLARRGDDDAPEPLQELGRFDIMCEVVVRGVSVVRGVRGPRAGAGRNRHCRASLAHLASPSVQGRIAARRCVSILEFTTQRECGPTSRADYSAERYSRRLCARGNRAPSSIARSGTPAQGVRTESPCTAFSTAPLSSLNALPERV